MTLAEAQHRQRKRQWQHEVLRNLELCIIVAWACVAVSGCLICEWKTPVLDLQLNGVIHKPVMDE